MDETVISVPTEFYEHFRKVKQMRDAICADEDAKDAAKVASLNSTTAIIRDLVAMEERVHNAERFAVLQQVVVSCLKEVSPLLCEKVLAEFESRVGRL